MLVSLRWLIACDGGEPAFVAQLLGSLQGAEELIGAHGASLHSWLLWKGTIIKGSLCFCC